MKLLEAIPCKIFDYIHMNTPLCKALLPVPGFLYVEGTFYNDMRRSDAADLSETVRIFCARHSIAAPAAHEGAQEGSGYRTARMEDTTFADLWLRVGPGSGYVYCHQVQMLRRPHFDWTALSDLAKQTHAWPRVCSQCMRVLLFCFHHRPMSL